ncbi:glycoside hydrolase family 97 catalytic domain-containing protein [Planctomycetota bacterium]|nr:glycoside hydrolase family 97 catalytic domain-containing protein [Planctomycetota bacterium]
MRDILRNKKQWIALPLVHLLTCICIPNNSHAQSQELTSPDGKLTFNLFTSNANWLYYTVSHDNFQLIDNSSIGIRFDNKTLYSQVSNITSSNQITVDENLAYRGHRSNIRNHYNEKTFSITSNNNIWGGPNQIQVRVFNGGLAFRYSAPTNGNVRYEATSFKLSQNTDIWYGDREQTQQHTKLLNWNNDQGGIVTAKYDNGYYLALGESNNQDYTGIKYYPSANNIRAEITDGSVPMQTGQFTAWRTVHIAQNLNDLAHSTLIPQLADRPDQTIYDDTSYIKPGVALWSWLGMNPGSNYDENGYKPANQMNIPRQKEYIDAADLIGAEHILVDFGWKLNYNGTRGFNNYRGKSKWQNLSELSSYGENKGVGVWVWENEDQLRDASTRDQFFQNLQNSGVSGIKIDFFDGEYSSTLTYLQDILKDADEHELMVNFHGVHVPNGLDTTFPNEMTREGIRGLEHSNPKHNDITAETNAILPFTRMIAGHGDYTPVTLNPDRMLTNYSQGDAGGTTYTHQLATMGMYISPVLHLGLSVEEINNLNANSPDIITYLTDMETVWDESIVLEGSEIGKQVMIARRTGNDWFLFAINGEQLSVTLNDVDLSFLDDAASYDTMFILDKAADINTDPELGDPLLIPTMHVNNLQSNYDLDINLLSAGGFIAQFKYIPEPGIAMIISACGLLIMTRRKNMI